MSLSGRGLPVHGHTHTCLETGHGLQCEHASSWTPLVVENRNLEHSSWTLLVLVRTETLNMPQAGVGGEQKPFSGENLMVM